MNILDKLPFLSGDSNAEPAEQTEAEAKAERIAHHRAFVRNGPRAVKTLTNGQVKRAQRRALARRTKKAHQAQVRNYFETQRLGALVRAHLQTAGLLPFIQERDLDLHAQVVSAAWLVQRFGEEQEDGTVSFAYFDVIDALSAALKFYGQVVGLPNLQVPAHYVVPVYEEGTKPAETDALRAL